MNTTFTHFLESIPIIPIAIGMVIVIVVYLLRRVLRIVLTVSLAVLTVCTITTLVDIPGVQGGTLLIAGLHGYEIITEQFSYDEAQKGCEKHGGYLINITSEFEYQMISQKLVRMGLFETDFYIGSVLEEITIDTETGKNSSVWFIDAKKESFNDTLDQELGTKYVRLYYDTEEERWNFKIDIENNKSQYFFSNVTGYICEYSIPDLIIRKVVSEMQKSIVK